MNFSQILMITVRTPKQLEALNMTTYIFAAIFALAFLLVAAVISNLIKYGRGNDKDVMKRKLVFWVMGVLGFISLFLYNFFLVSPTIKSNLQGKFGTTNIIACVIVFVTYVILGLVISKIMKRGKLGNWFGSKK